MILYRSLLRELTLAASAVLAVLVAIMVTTQLVRVLGMAAGGRVAADGVGAVLGFTSLQLLPVVLSLTLFIAVLTCLGRAHRDSEMVVWAASGVSPLAWLLPVLGFALPVAVVTGALSLGLAPWASQKSDEFRRQLATRDESASVAAGVFRESRGGDRVFFVESLSREDGSVTNVFVHSVQHQRAGTMVASRGFLLTRENGDRFLVLENGRRYEGVPGSAEYRVMEFARYEVRIDTAQSRDAQRSVKSMPTTELLASPSAPHLAELTWRFGLPIMALVLALAAIPLSYVNPRMGRSFNIVFAVLLYMIYSNMLSIAQAWVAQGKVPAALGFWMVHAAMLVLTLGLFRWRAFGPRRRRLWRRRGSREAAQ